MLLLLLLVERAGSAATVYHDANGTRKVEGAREGKHRELDVAQEGKGREVQGMGRRCWTSAHGVSRCQANVFFFGVSKAGETACTVVVGVPSSSVWVDHQNPAVVVEL